MKNNQDKKRRQGESIRDWLARTSTKDTSWIEKAKKRRIL